MIMPKFPDFQHVIGQGIFKYRSPFLFVISLKWLVQIFNNEIQFLIQGHRVLTFVMPFGSIPATGIYKLPVFSFIRIKWQVLRFDNTIQFIIEGHRVLTIDSNNFLKEKV